MECEGLTEIWEMEFLRSTPKNFNFDYGKGKFSIFPHGRFLSHLDQVLNSELRYGEFNLLNCNVSSINYIVNRITSYLLIERFIKWLELIRQPERFRNGYPDDNIPMYLAQMPLKSNEEISFYLPKDRILYIKNVIKAIGMQKNCPIKKTTKYPPFQHPIQVAIDNAFK